MDSSFGYAYTVSRLGSVRDADFGTLFWGAALRGGKFKPRELQDTCSKLPP
jgi:hypothetical protein